MIKANELRIGNRMLYKPYGNRDGELVVIAGILGMKAYFSKYTNESGMLFNLQPIPLTEEWLVNLGFVKSPHDSIGDLDLEMPDNNELEYGRSDRAITFNGMYLPKQPEFVHQLQNLFFALTGEELTIKEPG